MHAYSFFQKFVAQHPIPHAPKEIRSNLIKIGMNGVEKMEGENFAPKRKCVKSLRPNFSTRPLSLIFCHIKKNLPYLNQIYFYSILNQIQIKKI